MKLISLLLLVLVGVGIIMYQQLKPDIDRYMRIRAM